MFTGGGLVMGNAIAAPEPVAYIDYPRNGCVAQGGGACRTHDGHGVSGAFQCCRGTRNLFCDAMRGLHLPAWIWIKWPYDIILVTRQLHSSIRPLL